MKILHNRKNAGTFGVDELKRLDARALHAVLATSHDDVPSASLVSYAFDDREKIFVFLTPKKTTKYGNLVMNPNVSLLIDTRENSGRDYSSGVAYTVMGHAAVPRRGRRRERLLAAFLRKHRSLSGFSRERTTALVTVDIQRCFKVTRFQEIFTYEPPGMEECRG